MSAQNPNHAMASPNGSVPGATTRAWIAYSRAKNEKPKLTAAPQNIQPIGCVRWVVTMRAPTTPQANSAATLQMSIGLTRPTNLNSRARLTPAKAT